MTRKEAIDRLKEARIGHKEFLSIETLNMAIKALEQESCEDVNKDKIIRTEEEVGNFEIWCDNGQCGFVIASFDTKEEAERKVNEWNKDGDAKYSLCEKGE